MELFRSKIIMKIAYIVPKLTNKGPVIVVKELVTMMTKYGHECKVFYFDKETEISMPCGTEHISIYKSIDFNSFDIVHSHGIRPDCYIFIHKPRKCRAKTITTLHNYVYQDFKYQYNVFVAATAGTLWIKLLSRHDKVVTLSKNAMNYYSKWIDPKKLYYAYNTRFIEHTDEKPDIEDKKLINEFKGNSILIGINAALTERKGVDQVIKALPELKDYRLAVIGNGKVMTGLKKMATELGVHDRVLFMGYRKNAYRFLRYYDIYALPSRSEGFVLTLLEAAIYKKNVVCSDIPIFRETVSDEEAAFFEINNIPSLVKAVRRAHECGDLGKNLNDRYKKMYSPECFYNKYISIYSK